MSVAQHTTYISMTQVCQDLNVSYKTLQKLLKDSGIVPFDDPHDMRRKVIEVHQLQQLHELHTGHRKRKPADSEKMVSLETRIIKLEQRLQLSASVRPLPEHHVALEDFALAHNIQINHAIEAVEKGLVWASEGPWIDAGRTIQYILSPNAQFQFCLFFRDDYTFRPNIRCCPHKLIRVSGEFRDL